MPRMYREADGTWTVPGKQTRKAELVIIPDRTAEFCEWLNDNMKAKPILQPVAHPVLPGGADATFEPDEPSLEQHLGADDIMADGHPRGRQAFTSAQVNASALPMTSTKVQDVCQLVSKMNAGELGYVALEVIARGARLGGVA